MFTYMYMPNQDEWLYRVQDFINREFKENHILSTSKDVFNFQYYDNFYDRYNFLIAYNNDDMSIAGVLGFTRFNQYDYLYNHAPVSLALWKRSDDIKVPKIVAMKLLQKIFKDFNNNLIYSSGLSQNTINIYTALHLNVDKMEHYYIANPYIDNYLLIESPEKNNNHRRSNSELIEISLKRDLNNISHVFYPHRSIEYLWNRYIKNPFFKYTIAKISNNKSCLYVVYRICSALGVNCLRIIDMAGDIYGDYGDFSSLFIDKLRSKSIEYIDCMCYNIPESIMKSWGFSKKSTFTVIPDHFSPFKKKNSDIFIMYRGENKPVIFKGDCDQDRPNRLIDCARD